MKTVLSWLNDLAPVGHDADALAAALDRLGLAVEAVERSGGAVAGVVTARVLRTERHPEAAKVQRVYVDVGGGVERHVWCGASNMRAGDVVALATPGTTMPDGTTIEPRPILGIESQGMLCSASELGLGDDHSGIVVLAPDSPLGVPYGDVLGLVDEVVLDLDLTRNRPDCWGHLGIARDLAAHLGVELTARPGEASTAGPERSAPVDIVDGARCGRFTTTVLSGVTVGPSPRWMARRLEAAGMRSIDNVVDVSNYVMLESNQPNHAYDLDRLGGGGLRVRRGGAGERLVTLDGVDRALDPDDLLVCDATDVPIGLAGVMGGLESEVRPDTTAIALEVAWFDPTSVARTALRHGLRSEASARFERGVDPYGSLAAVARFAELLRETCPDLVVHPGAVDARGTGLPPADRTTTLRPSQVERVLGIEIDPTRIVELLHPIGYLTEPGAHGELVVHLPSWRPDSTSEIDVIEELARHHGYDRLGRTVPKSTVHGRLSGPQQRRRQLRQVLLGLGVSEAMPNPFLAPGDLAAARLDGCVVAILNPLVAEESVLRTSLRPGLLKAVAFNESHRRPGVSLYEIGHVYPAGDGPLPDEHEVLAVVLAGREAPAAMSAWREVAVAMRLGARVDQQQVPAGLHPTRSATLWVGRDTVGAVGEIHPDVLEAFGVAERVAIVELDLTVLLAAEPKVPTWRPTSRYPSSDIDLAFVVPDPVVAEKVDKAIRQAAGNLLVDLSLFDVYRGQRVEPGTRGIAYRLRLQAADRTLTDAEVGAVRDKAITAVTKLGASLRGS